MVQPVFGLGLPIGKECRAISAKPAIENGQPVRDKLLVFGNPLIEDDAIAEVVDSLRSGWLGTGPKVHAFENMFRAYLGVDHCAAVSSCTAGLHLSMLALGIGSGDEVIVPVMTFAATANAIFHAGARMASRPRAKSSSRSSRAADARPCFRPSRRCAQTEPASASGCARRPGDTGVSRRRSKLPTPQRIVSAS